jgi:hypothetical protein
MSIHRFDARVDKAAPEIVTAIRDEGWDCHLIRLPCDVLCWHPVLDIWQPLEIATKGGKRKADATETQRKFLRWTSLPVVYTPAEALEALRKHHPAGTVSAELAAWAIKLRDDFELEWKRTGKAAGAAERVHAQGRLLHGADLVVCERQPLAHAVAGDLFSMDPK